MNERLAQSVRRLIDATIRTQVDVQTLATVTDKIDWATEQLSASLLPGSFGVQQSADGQSMALGNVVIGRPQPGRASPRHCTRAPTAPYTRTSFSAPPTRDRRVTFTAVFAL